MFDEPASLRKRDPMTRRRGGLALILPLILCGCLPHPLPPAETPEAPPPPDPYAAIDRHALCAPEETRSSVQALADYLITPAESDEDRARAVYRWVTAHIAYDVDGFLSGEYADADPGNVLRSGSAVCHGYASLFDRLAAAAGLEVVQIRGYAKGAGYAVGHVLPSVYNHSWNAVRIAGRWRLIDTTWGAGALEADGSYVREFEPFYFLTDPEAFAATHFPIDPRWQLLEEPLSRQAFQDLPYLKPAFFDCGLKLLSHRDGRIRLAQPAFWIELEAPEEVRIIARLSSPRGEFPEEMVTSYRESSRICILGHLPEPGEYVLRVFAAPRPDATVFDWAMDYALSLESPAHKIPPSEAQPHATMKSNRSDP